MKHIAILGFGVVGSGVAEGLTQNKDIISSYTHEEYNIKAILDVRKFPDSPFASIITDSFDTIINDPEIDIVAECMGGSHPAYDYSKALLENGKCVVTSNKEVVARYGTELIQIAKAHHVSYLFEASVGGGIPVLTPMIHQLAQNHFMSVAGILNGTTNYILTKMKNEGMTFADALSDAQTLGYAERNPDADVEGLDAARKIVILAAIAFGKMASPEDITIEGITDISKEDHEIAEMLGAHIKLVGYATMQDNQLLCMVSPRLVFGDSPLYGVDDVFNAVVTEGDLVGQTMFYGRGAGKLPTASAIISDLMACMTHDHIQLPDWENAVQNTLLPFDQYVTRHCVVIEGQKDDAKIVASLWNNVLISVGNGILIVITPPISEKEINQMKSRMTLPIKSHIRILD